MKKHEKKVSILLAVYNPNIQWLREQLISLDKQTYGNIEILARDDCSPDFSIDALHTVFQECLQETSWSLKRNEKNLGSNATFELLTKEADGAYFAYCDQDDFWHPHKIKTLVKLIEKTESVLVCSDMEIIDENGKKTADSITDVRKRQVFRRGTNLTRRLLYNNFVTGCTMLVKKETAQAAVPFVEGMFHDHWIALYASMTGRIEYTKETLICYRIHSENQSGVLAGIKKGKEEYRNRIQRYDLCYRRLLKRIGTEKEITKEIYAILRWTKARKIYFEKPNLKDFCKMIRGYRYGRRTVLFEIVLPFIPEKLYKTIINLIKKGFI